MQFVNDPVKSKRIFILMLCLTIFFFLAAGGLGYLYWQEKGKVTTANADKDKLQDDYDKLVAEKKALEDASKAGTASAEAAQKQIKDLQDQISATTAKNNRIRGYTDTLDYVAKLIRSHNGIQGWTEAEYQAGRRKAQATENNTFIALIDWCWTATSVNPLERTVRFLEGVSEGVNSNLK